MLKRVTGYLSLLEYARRPGGGFHNFLSYQRQWLDTGGNGDWSRHPKAEQRPVYEQDTEFRDPFTFTGAPPLKCAHLRFFHVAFRNRNRNRNRNQPGIYDYDYGALREVRCIRG